jgi:hypothetical protein
MPRTIGPHTDVATEDESYQDGYKTGRNWKYDYVPGGPWICRDKYAQGWFAQYCAASAHNHAAWMRGWHEGRKKVQPLIEESDLSSILPGRSPSQQ